MRYKTANSGAPVNFTLKTSSNSRNESEFTAPLYGEPELDSAKPQCPNKGKRKVTCRFELETEIQGGCAYLIAKRIISVKNRLYSLQKKNGYQI